MSDRLRRSIAALTCALVLPLTFASTASADQATSPASTQQNQQQQVDNDSDWEWIGLFGLLGLLGLIPRKRKNESRNTESMR